MTLKTYIILAGVALLGVGFALWVHLSDWSAVVIVVYLAVSLFFGSVIIYGIVRLFVAIVRRLER